MKIDPALRRAISFGLLTPLFFFGCATLKNGNGNPMPYLEYAKGACFGFCPSFRLSLYEDGTLLFESRRFTKKEGIYTRQLTKKERSAVHQNYANADWESYMEYYESQIPDLQMITFESDGKKTRFRENGPRELQIFSRILDTIALKGEWQKLSSGTGAADFGHHEMIVQLKKDKKPDVVLLDLKPGIVTVVKRVSDHLNTWLLSYNAEEISEGQLYKFLKDKAVVKNIEFNAQLQLREE